MKDKSRILSIVLSIVCVFVLIGFDQLTKYLVSHNERLLNGETIIVIKYLLSFHLAYNKGAAWSILSGKKFFLVGMSTLASIITVGVLVLKADFKKNLVFTISFILICAGAIGNLIDRAFFSEGVIDFLNLEFMDFPIFNVADSCLTLGAIGLVIYIIFFYKEPKKVENKEETKNDDTVGEEVC